MQQMKQQLTEIKKTNNNIKIAKTELKIAKKIKIAVSNFPYQIDSEYPSNIISNKKMNYVGATLLASALLEEIGINHLKVGLTNHSMLILNLSNNKLILYDPTPTYEADFLRYEELKDKDINGINEKGEVLTTTDIINLFKFPTTESIRFKVNNKSYLKYLKLLETKSNYINISDPRIGLSSSLFCNLGNFFHKNSNYEKAIDAYINIIKLDPQKIEAYYNLGNVFYKIGKNEEAIEVCQKIIQINKGHS